MKSSRDMMKNIQLNAPQKKCFLKIGYYFMKCTYHMLKITWQTTKNVRTTMKYVSIMKNVSYNVKYTPYNE